MKKVLPPTYYLDHFNELLAQVEHSCAHLLTPHYKNFIQAFRSLNKQSQLLLVRIFSRKPKILPLTSLHYAEITHFQSSWEQLTKLGLATHPVKSDFSQHVLPALTKAELINIPKVMPEIFHTQPTLKKSVTKAELVCALSQLIELDHASVEAFCQQYVLNFKEEFAEYLEFLFLGTLRTSFYFDANPFVLRDMGIIRTRGTQDKFVPQFDSIEAAQSCYEISKVNAQFKSYTQDNEYESLIEVLLNIELAGSGAIKVFNKLVLKLVKKLKYDHRVDMLLAKCIDCPKASEYRIRARYKAGDKEWVKAELALVIALPIDDEHLFFAQDFYQRKYQQVLRSPLTDMLETASRALLIDEYYRGASELGVIAQYRSKKVDAYRTENELWLSFFALFFWQELFLDKLAKSQSEFEVLPRVLRNQTFYKEQASQIENRLGQFVSNQAVFKHIVKNTVKYHGHANGIFNWHEQILETLEPFILCSALTCLIGYLRHMAKHFQMCRDGYPDIMVIDGGKARFEEVKAPGDKVRRNQLTTIEMLRKLGWQVDIARVTWQVNPEQIYTVIDVETTGGGGNYHRVTEIGLVQVQNGRVIEEWSSLINPCKSIPAYITQLTGITNEMVHQAPLFQEIAELVLAKLQGTVFVAHNVNFDFGFMKREFESVGQKLHMPKLCTVVEARKTFPKLPSYSLGNLCQSVNIELTHHHRALADARATAELLIMMQQLRNESFVGVAVNEFDHQKG